ncbi:MAG: hypothetical protein FGM38_06425 [Solirubrobacterales bacterium]|nr:hypothetical protein [Solirubrobacterales bacterium]
MGFFPEKVAVTDRASLIVTTQLPVPEHPAPDQPVKLEPGAGVAVRVTLVLSLKRASQVEPHSMPAGLEATLPSPLPASWTASG